MNNSNLSAKIQKLGVAITNSMLFALLLGMIVLPVGSITLMNFRAPSQKVLSSEDRRDDPIPAAVLTPAEKLNPQQQEYLKQLEEAKENSPSSSPETTDAHTKPTLSE